MNIWTLPQKVIEKSLNLAFRAAGTDRLTGVSISKRSDLVTIGSQYGAWVVPAELINADSICYCVGCGEDITFDTGLIERFACHVYAFDPTPRAIEHVRKVAASNKKYHFSALGLWDKKDTLKFFVPKNPTHVSHSLVNLQSTDEYLYVEVDRLSSVMASNHHSSLDLLKLDIEGAEYKVIESILEDDIAINVLCVEYDEYFNPLDNNYRARIRASVQTLLAAGYNLACAQGNGNYTFVHGN